MIDINGSGFGDSHDWKCDEQGSWDKVALWRCKRCNRGFRHLYEKTPDIFKAIEESGLPDKCEAL